MAAMRVGFDTSALTRSAVDGRRGVSRVVENLLAALERRGRIEVVRLQPEPGRDERKWRHRELPAAVERLSLAGLHSFTSAYPTRGPGRRVQTIHELPWKYGVAENAGWRHRWWASWGTRAAQRTLVPTQHVADALMRNWGVREDRVRVCPWGVGPPFQVEPPAGVIDEVVLGELRLPQGPLVLCPGAVRPKKNLAAVLRGLARVNAGERKLSLVVTGPETEALRADLGLASRLGLGRWIHTVGELDDDRLASLIRLSVAVPVLSHSEGFGLTVLEALACGTPVLVPPNSAQAEVGGEAAAVVDPADDEAVASALLRAFEQREELRYRLPERAEEFTWDATAAIVERTWEELSE